MSYETANWLYVPAKYPGPKRTRPVELVVIHTAESPESEQGAENLAKYFQHPDYVSSPHICTDNNSIVQCVKDSFVAYAAPGANHNGIQIEIAGKMGQSKSDWLDFFSIGCLAITADAVAQYCLKYTIPPIHISTEQLLAGEKGVIGHYQASAAFKKSDHQDPGPNFPWVRFMSMVNIFMLERRA